VEHPLTGDPQRGLKNLMSKDGGINPLMEVPNRGKRSLGLDISTDGGREILYRLIAGADVFLTNALPDVRHKLGIDVDDIRRVNPQIIFGRGTGQGVRGTEAERPGFDLPSAWARAAVADHLTPDGGEPPFPPGAIGDVSGGLNLAGAVAAALFRRERTGQGAVVDMSLYSTGMWLTSQLITGAALGNLWPKPDRKTSFNPLVNYYPTKDGRWVCLCLLQADRHWPDLLRHVQREDLLDDSRFATAENRFEHRAAMVTTLDEIFRCRTLDEWREILSTLSGAWAPVFNGADIIKDPQVFANGFFPEVEIGDGTTYRIVASPAQFDEQPVGRLTRGPEHGEHTEAIMLDLDFTWDEITDLKERKIII
jgi:crotonobetainyl-CoA:carnitine CoA-transferase CaiB-like acyl-CoA transferase